MGIGSPDHRRFDKVSHGFVVTPAGDDLRLLVFPGAVDITSQLVEGAFVDHRGHEIAEVGRGTRFPDVFKVFLNPAEHILRQGLRQVDTGGSAAFLALEFKCPPGDGGGHLARIGGGMRDDKILSAGLPDDARVGFIGIDIVADLFPDTLEDFCGTRIVQPGEIRMGEQDIRDHGRVSVDAVDHAGRHARLFKDIHDDLGRKDLVIAGFPDHHIAHQGRTGRQVAGNGCKVKWGNGVDEAFQGAVFHPVPDALCRFGLFLVDLAHKLHVEPQKVDQFAGRIDLGLVDGLGLGHHGGGVDPVPVRPGDQFGRLQKNRSPLFPGECSPVPASFERGIHGLFDFLFRSQVVLAHCVLVVVGRGNGARFAGTHLLPADGQRDVGVAFIVYVVLFKNGFAFRGSRGVALYRLVEGRRDLEKSVTHIVLFCS